MSDINTKATVTLQVNGQQAEQTLSQLKSNALQLEAAIAKAAAAGNKADLKKLRKELGETKKQIREIETSTMQVDSVMRKLDRATPKELQKTLQTLNRQLDYMERGSDAWNAHIEKIKKVKAEIASVNEEIRGQEGWFSRMNHTLNDWQTSIMGAAAVITGLIMAGRKAVSAFAEMDAEMASVRKYTGMTAEQVEELNEEMKTIDTRTAREELNQLAQEAGRLGKTTQEDVMGFVRAADQINVALDDLGEGATLTLSKLTNIFGDEERLGTEKALLSVGSVINELSQNCTASAPYLANFAQRLAGVGAQANMSIPQIMGFAAVLDSQGQKVEMSATALSKLIMNLFKNPAKIAKATGMDMKTFTDTCVKDTNEGLLMLLQRLHELGDMSVLAPVFADMGENGTRASAVIAALAGNLEMVRWEQSEAAKAFEEGTSVTKEFDVQNNTVQAGLDKAKKRINELAISLGEKLMPVMRHIISTSTLSLKALSAIVDFIIEYRKEITSAIVVLAAYTVGVNAHTIATKVSAAAMAAWNTVAHAVTATTKGYTAAMVLSRDALAGCTLANGRLYKVMLSQNVITKLLTASTLLMKAAYYAVTLQSAALSTTLKSLYVVMAANPYGLVLAGLAAVGVAIYNNIQKRKEQAKAIAEERQRQKELMKDYDDAAAKIKLLSKVLNDNTRDLKDRRDALDELKKIVPGYHADLTQEGELINSNTEALDDYLVKLKESILMRANREKLEELYKKQADLETTQREQSDKYWDIRQTNTAQGYDRNSVTAKINNAWNKLLGNENTEAGAKAVLDKTEKELKDVNAQIAELEKKVVPVPSEPDFSSSNNDGDGDGGGTTTTETPTGPTNSDKFAAEKEWKKKEEAINRIAYAKGEKDYTAYQERTMEIEVEYNEKKLSHTDLTQSERLSIEAEFYEARRKQVEAADKRTIEEENASYNEQMSIVKQRFIDGESSLSVYEEATEQAEMEHLRKLIVLYAEGSKEQLDAQKQLQDKAFANQKKHQQEYEAAVKKHQDALAKMKEEFFGDNPQERQAKYAADLALLTEVYDAEIAAAEDNAKEKLRIEEAFQKAKLALQKQYNIESEDNNLNFLQQWNDDVIDFLASETGHAIAGTMETVASSMSAVFQQLTSIVQAELEIQTAAIEKKYEREISLAEGNNYKVKRLEKAKEAEIAKVKNEANKKMFAMQVIQAVAQTATGAINAYSSAAAVPVVGYILAPIAAAAAVAAGMLQVAAIKKQQQASEATGYSSGGFTPDGKVDEAVGVVHAGEWVASQRLTKNPKTRPLLEALDYAQKNNSVGTLDSSFVSQSITAPVRLANYTDKVQSSPQRVVVENHTVGTDASSFAQYADTMKKLQERLDEPFVTVNTVTGDFGSKKAQDDYEKLIRNKTPKSRRS